MSAEKTEKIVAAAIVGSFLAAPIYGAVQSGLRGFFVGLGAILLWIVLYFGFFGMIEWRLRKSDPNRHLNDYAEVRRREFEELRRRGRAKNRGNDRPETRMKS
jgi:hypothetical protein